MANELLDFKKRDDFEFLYFSAWGERTRGAVQLKQLKDDCKKVLDRASKTVLDLCLLGRELQKLKEDTKWQSVWNEEIGRSFEYDTFESFCAYAFGFSQTRTSDLLRIAKFVTDDEEPKFINDEYREYNTSQLIELAAVKDYDWKYFNPTMTVSDMRRVKKYMREGDFYWRKNEPGFDVMEQTSAWEIRKEAEKEKKNTVTPTTNVLPGQISLTEEVFESEEDELEESENQISDLAQEGGMTEKDFKRLEEIIQSTKKSETTEPEYITKAREAAHAAGIPFYEGDAEEFDPYVYDGKMSVEDYQLMHKLREEGKQDETEDLEEEDPYDMPMQTHSFDRDDSTEAEENEPEEETSSAEEKKSGYDFSTRDNIRIFLNDYKNWNRRDDILTPHTKHCYWYTLKNFDIVYAFETKIANARTLTGEHTYDESVSYFIFLKSKYKDDIDVFEIGKRLLENYLMSEREELNRFR